MSGAPAAQADAEASATDASAVEAVVWRYDPWHERPRVAALGALAAVVLCLVVLSLRESSVLTIGLCLACLASFSAVLTPVECRLEAGGPAKRGLFGWERRPWTSLRRLQALPAGVRLTAYSTPHWLDSTRGLVLPMPAARRSELIEAVRRELERHGA